MKTFQVTREPRYEGDDSLHGSKQYAPDDFLILVDGAAIGGTYWGGANDGPGHWHSWGPVGYSLGHMSREGAEDAQVRAYAIDPSLVDRLNADTERERVAEERRQQDEWVTQDSRHRLDDGEPGPVIWTLPACHALYAPMDEVRAVGAWLAANDIELNNWHDARLEQRAGRLALVYEAEPAIAGLARAMGNRNVTVDMTVSRAATVTTTPPLVTVPPRPDLRPLFEKHFPARFPLIDFGANTVCAECTRAAHAVTVAGMVPWPCAVVREAIAVREAASAHA